MGTATSDAYGDDLFTEAEGQDDTLANLGPLRPLAGAWEGTKGADRHPVAGGGEPDLFLERYDLQPIDRQTNGPQLYYGLRYHTHIVRPGEVETFHDQIGYWLWEPAAQTVVCTVAIPRGQVVLAAGPAAPDATTFTVRAEAGEPTYGICSNPFLERAFRTTSFEMTVTVHPDGTWSYQEVTVLELPDRAAPFRHTDANTLHRVAPPIPNPLAT